MNPFDVLALSVRSLTRNLVRTALTMLGIVIGIASVIAMVALGQGASAMVQSQIDSMGRNLLMVLPGAQTSSGGVSYGGGSVQTLTAEDAGAILKEISGVTGSCPVERTRGQLIYGSQNWIPSTIMGVGTGFVDVREWNLEEGSFFSEGEVLGGAKVCVLGLTVAENLFGSESAVGKEMRIKNIPFRVLGVLSRKGTNALGQDQDDLVVAPWTTVKRSLQGSSFSDIDQILVTASTSAALADAGREITALLRQRHRLREGEDSDFRLLTMTEMASASVQTSAIMTILLATIASISLVVGGIGIMNTMLVSVVERTREIGVRMAVGARGRDILVQFLAESVLISLTAGMIGMALGALAGDIVARTMRWPVEISPSSIGIAFGFSCGVGIFFGFYPAWRAARLDPIEALRYE